MLALIRRGRAFVNVYEGVSPSLLATMSMGVNIGGQSQRELVASLRKAQLIGGEHEAQAWESVDRRYFTKAVNPYLNRPCGISKGENMTDIFTHAVIISNLSAHWQPKMRVLDIGTGHGYLALLIAKILDCKDMGGYEIRGVDVHQEAIDKCK
jgi:protein-L-isoaspartate O-methyltransferase